ncbi:MAG: L,D-transpeptidase family protein [Ferruginibacter sp.]
MNEYVRENIGQLLASGESNNGILDSTLQLKFFPVVQFYYSENDNVPLWSNTEKWTQPADSLLSYLQNAAYDGLFKADYHFDKLKVLKNTLEIDSLKRMDAVLWAKADLLFTDAFMHIIQDLKQGRLQPDSVSLKYNKGYYKKFFAANLYKFKQGESLASLANSLQPSIPGYLLLKQGLRNFVDSMDTRTFTYLKYPYKDSLEFIKTLQKRLAESSIVTEKTIDSTQLQFAIKKYQTLKGSKTDGKISAMLIRAMNLTGPEKFKRIAITLDRYKLLPVKMPAKYIWVNLPAYNLKVWDADTLVLESKIICGKPATPTPLITSAISDIIIYPTWTLPPGIIKKEILPGLKKNSDYLARKGFNLLNDKGEIVDPATVNWNKYSKGIPYKVQQGSGDDNALGVIKFNFNNPYFVYLHDTNQRYLFKNSVRSISHGCVRVQEWEKLAFYLVRNDSLLAKQPDSLHYNTDSITNWIALKERHRIDVKNKFPLFIRYFGCELVKGTIRFYDDMYGEDKLMREKYFSAK